MPRIRTSSTRRFRGQLLGTSITAAWRLELRPCAQADGARAALGDLRRDISDITDMTQARGKPTSTRSAAGAHPPKSEVIMEVLCVCCRYCRIHDLDSA